MVFADTDGSDDDWATFYSDWLLTRRLPSTSAIGATAGTQPPYAPTWSNSTSSTQARHHRKRGRPGTPSVSWKLQLQGRARVANGATSTNFDRPTDTRRWHHRHPK